MSIVQLRKLLTSCLRVSTELVYDPREFYGTLFALYTSWSLITIWNYKICTYIVLSLEIVK